MQIYSILQYINFGQLFCILKIIKTKQGSLF